MEGNGNNSSVMPEIRRNLVNTAVQFLNMERIQPQPESIKRKFLQKKGLSNDEIEEAFKQAKNVGDLANFGQSDLHDVSIRPTPFIFEKRSISVWSKFKDLTQALLFLTGFAFGAQYLYKHYIGPLLTGRSVTSAEDKMLQVQAAVMDVLKQIENTLENINHNILANNKSSLNDSSLADLKTDMTVIKSILVNKKSFPATPSLSPSIPEWQRLSKNPSTNLDAENSELYENASTNYSEAHNKVSDNEEESNDE